MSSVRRTARPTRPRCVNGSAIGAGEARRIDEGRVDESHGTGRIDVRFDGMCFSWRRARPRRRRPRRSSPPRRRKIEPAAAHASRIRAARSEDGRDSVATVTAGTAGLKAGVKFGNVPGARRSARRDQQDGRRERASHSLKTGTAAPSRDRRSTCSLPEVGRDDRSILDVDARSLAPLLAVDHAEGDLLALGEGFEPGPR